MTAEGSKFLASIGWGVTAQRGGGSQGAVGEGFQGSDDLWNLLPSILTWTQTEFTDHRLKESFLPISLSSLQATLP